MRINQNLIETNTLDRRSPEVQMNLRKKRIISCLVGLLCFAGLFALDLFSKHLAIVYLKGKPDIPIAGDFFVLQYLENRGAAFGILQGKMFVFTIITWFIIAVILFLYLRLPYGKRYLPLRVIGVLIAAGAVGNFSDRLSRGYVVDFFYFKSVNFAIFNVADIYVTCSAIALVFYLLFFYKEEDYQNMGKSIGFHKKKN